MFVGIIFNVLQLIIPRKMSIEREVKIEVTVRNILLSLVDIGMFMFEYGDKGRFYRKDITDYRSWRERDRIRFAQNLYYLKKKKLIKSYVVNKKRYVELTPKGKKRARYYFLKRKILRPKKRWDGKWRVVIFDICEDKKSKRETIREWLKNIGLIELQRSVYVYPFEFKRQLDLMVGALMAFDVKYMVCEIIEGEENLIDYFFEHQILRENDLLVKK